MDANTTRGLAAIAAAAGDEADTRLMHGASRVVSVGPSEAELAAQVAAVGAAKTEGVTGERARIGAIVNSPEAKGREQLAQHLAFNTDLSAEASIAMLKAAPVAAPEKGSRLDGKVPVPKVDAIESGNAADDRVVGLSKSLTRQLAKIGKQPLTH